MDSKLSLFLLVCGVLGAVYGQSFVRPEDCPPCDPAQCDLESIAKCGAGTVKDRCMCCDVCAKTEYEMCDHPDAKNPKGISYGKCGENLECRLREDLSDEEAPEALCYCLDDTTVCGSNGQTYNNLCGLKAASAYTGQEIRIEFNGPCQNAPVIVSGPEHVRNTTGANIFLVCEAKGFPIPSISWIWTRVDGETMNLPNDDIHVSVNTRGGPEKWEVTGWLQIMELEKHHEGDYVCVAQNDLGIVKATARVNVKDGDHPRKNRKEKNHHNEI